MNFNEFKAIIRHIKLNVRCVKCSHFFKDEHIWLFSVLGDDCLFNLSCEKCGTTTTLLANLKNNTQQVITKNDHSHMKKFLKNFNGDFKTLFKKK